MDEFDLYRMYKTLHLLAVVLLAGGITIETVVGPLMVRATTVQELRAFTRLSKIAENFCILPGLFLAIGFGYAMTGNDFGPDLDTTWVLLGQILAFVALAVSIGYLRTASLRIDGRARQAPDGPVPDELRREMKNSGPPIVGAVLTFIFVLLIYLMVVKPAW